MRLSFIAVLQAICLLAIGPQSWAAETNSQAANPAATQSGAGSIRIRAQCKGQDEKVYGSPIVEVAENTPEAKLAAAETACRPILEKAGTDWDSACATYVAQLRPLSDAYMVLMYSGVQAGDPRFSELKTRREEVYRQFPECSAGRPVLSP